MYLPFSNRLIPVLTISCGALLTIYMILVVMAVFFATWQTQSVSSVRDTQSAIGNLEANYYTTVTHMTSIDPTSLGFVTPENVQYVAEAGDPSVGLSFAGK